MRTILTFCVLLTTPIVCRSDDDLPSQEDPTSIAKRIARFHQLNQTRLPAILAHPDETIRLGAYWRYLASEHRGPGREHQQSANAAKFLGYFTASTGFVPPKWWSRHFAPVSVGTTTGGDEFGDQEWIQELRYFRATYGDLDRDPPPDKVLGNLQLTPGMRVVDRNESIVRCAVGEQMVRIDTSEYSVDDPSRIRVIASDKATYLFQYDEDILSRSSLARLDPAGKVLWQQWLTGTGFTGGLTGSVPPGRCEVGLVDDTLVIFGQSWFGLFVEALAADDGKVRFHFSTYLAGRSSGSSRFDD